MKKNILIEGFKMACELLALEICDSLLSYHKEAKDAFIENLNQYLRAASCSGKWELDSDRDDLGVEVIGHDKMTLHLIKA